MKIEITPQLIYQLLNEAEVVLLAKRRIPSVKHKGAVFRMLIVREKRSSKPSLNFYPRTGYLVEPQCRDENEKERSRKIEAEMKKFDDAIKGVLGSAELINIDTGTVDYILPIVGDKIVFSGLPPQDYRLRFSLRKEE